MWPFKTNKKLKHTASASKVTANIIKYGMCAEELHGCLTNLNLGGSMNKIIHCDQWNLIFIFKW